MPKSTFNRALEMFGEALKPSGFPRGNYPLILAYHSLSRTVRMGLRFLPKTLGLNSSGFAEMTTRSLHFMMR